MKKYINILVLGLIASGLSSCLKDDNIDKQEYGMINLNAKKIIEIPSDLSHVSTVAIVPENETINKTILTVSLAAEQVAQEDLVVKIGTTKSAEIVNDYNAENDAVTRLESGYTLPSTVTIPKGSRSAEVQITWNPQDLSSKSYGLGVNIESVDKEGYILSGNYGSVMVLLTAKSPLDGFYNYKTSAGTALAPNLNDDGVRLTTVSATRVSGALANTYSNVIVYEIDPLTNKVKVISGLGTPATDPSSNWDPATGVMYVKWTASGYTIEETYTRTGESE